MSPYVVRLPLPYIRLLYVAPFPYVHCRPTNAFPSPQVRNCSIWCGLCLNLLRMYDAAAAGAPEEAAPGECKAETASLPTPLRQDGNSTGVSGSRRARDAGGDQQTAERKASQKARRGAAAKANGVSAD